MSRAVFRRVVAAALFGAGVLGSRPASATPTVSTIYPKSGAGGSFVITVLSDGYTDELQFGLDAAFLFVTRLMASDPFYLAHGSSFTIKTVFNKAAADGVSAFGISTTNRSSCNMSANPVATGQAIDAAAMAADPNTQFVAVLANDSVSFACTTLQHWTYVASGASDRRGVMAHELGHLIAGLYDEYNDGHTVYTGQAINQQNCSTKLAPQLPYWMSLVPPLAPLPTNPAGCHYSVSGIVRPYATCKMNDYDVDQYFCPVCKREMEAVLEPGPSGQGTPTPPAPPTGVRIIKARYVVQPTPPPTMRSVRLLLQVDLATNTTTVLSATNVDNARIVQRRIGDYVYALRENGTIFATGVLAGDPFESRVYGQTPKHTVVRQNSAMIVVLVPQATVQSLLTRAVEIGLYRLTESGTDVVTPDRMRSYLAGGTARTVALVTAQVLNDRLKTLVP